MLMVALGYDQMKHKNQLFDEARIYQKTFFHI